MKSLKASSDRLKKIRQQIGAAVHQIGSLDHERVSRDETLDRLDRFIERRSSGFFVGASSFTQVKQSDDFMGFADIAAACCALVPDVVRRKLIGELDDTTTYGTPLADRPAEKEKLLTQVLEWEIAEESLLRELESAGVAVERRSDLQNPLVIIMKQAS